MMQVCRGSRPKMAVSARFSRSWTVLAKKIGDGYNGTAKGLLTIPRWRAHTHACLEPRPNLSPQADFLDILRATEADLSHLAEIEQLTHGFWNEQDFETELKLEHSTVLTAMSLVAGKRVLAGLVLMWCLADEAQIIELAVHPGFRRQGIGLALMTRALAEGSRIVKSKYGRGAAILEVSSDNVPAIALYKKLGFRESGVRKGYYPDGSDAHTMRLRIN